MGSAATLVLASTSPYRRSLLARLGLEFEVVAPPFEEHKALRSSGEELARENAAGKVDSLAGRFPQHLLLGSDQVCLCEGRVLEKAGTVERACEQLRWLAGKTHHLHTAVALLDTRSGQLRSADVTTELAVRDLSDADVRSYVDKERPLDSAGSYYSEGLGVALFKRISGDDPTAVIGLPLIAVCRLLREAGLDPLAATVREQS